MKLSRLIAVAIVLLLTLSPTDVSAQGDKGSQLSDMQKQVADLERRIVNLEKQAAQNAPPNAAKEQKATTVFQEVQRLASGGDYTAAKAKLVSLNRDYAGTKAQQRSARLNQELAVIGKPAPAKYEIQKWFQGEDQIELGSTSKPTLIVFWEVWCGYCQKEVPKLEKLYTDFKDKGLQVVGLTKLSRSATEQKVLDFVKEKKVSYPIAKETGELSRYFNVSGIPAAAVVKDGKVVWRGHPGTLSPTMIQNWLGS